MATWNRLVTNSQAGNVPLNIDYAVASVTRTSNTNVRVVFGIRFSQYSSTYTYNSIAAFINGAIKYAFWYKDGHTSKGTYYYADEGSSTKTSERTPFTVDIPVSITQTSASITVGFGWNAYTPSQRATASFSVSFPVGATAPTGLYCNLSSRTETRVTLSGGYTSDGGASVTSSGYQYKTSSNGSWQSFSNGSTALSAGTTYWFRYYATNSQGTSYSSQTEVTTYAWPAFNSAPGFTIGNNVAIGFSNPRSLSVTVTLFAADGTSKSMGSTTGTSISAGSASDWKTFLYKSIPNNNSGKYQVQLSVSGYTSGKYGSNSYAIAGNENPTFDSTYITDVKETLHTDITGSNQKAISGHNKVTGTIKPATSNYNANLNNYVVSAGVSVTVPYSSSNTTFTLNNITSGTVTVTANDKRGCKSSGSKALTIIPYNKPAYTPGTNDIHHQNGTSTSVVLNMVGTYENWTGLTKSNSIQSIKYRYKPSGASSWTKDWTAITGFTSSGGKWALSNKVIPSVSFDIKTRYDFELQITDLLETVEYTGLLISTADALIWRDLKNKRVGIGKKPDHTLDVEGDIAAKTAIYLNGTKLFWYE